MGLFDFLKKKKHSVEKCEQCFRKIDPMTCRKATQKTYCEECYNRIITLENQRGDYGLEPREITESSKTFVCKKCAKKLALKYMQSNDICVECFEKSQNAHGTEPIDDSGFKMMIQDVFFLKNRGVVVVGDVSSGQIAVNDTVTVKGKDFRIRGITKDSKLLDRTATGDRDVGLLLDETESADYFKAGDAVISKHVEDTSVKTHISEEDYLDDITFIKDMKHLTNGPWHQYDVLLNAMGYGWDMMKEWADYMAEADLMPVSQVCVGALCVQEREVTKSYLANGGKCQTTPELETESGMLSIAGISQTLKNPMKIVWINQTQVLRFFTITDDELLIKKYVETCIRRTFGTENAMKLGKPIPMTPPEPNDFEILQKKCCELSKKDPESEELKKMKTEMWERLLSMEAIWVACDTDMPGEFPYIGLVGPMEVFTTEAYGKAAQTYFANNNEGHFSLKKIEKAHIKEWFEQALYMGATVFNLDNGFAPVKFTIEDYLPYDPGHDIGRKNRAVRCYLLRVLQAENRYRHIKGEVSEDTTKVFNQVISVLISNGFTALANSTVYALVEGPYIEDTEFYSKQVFESLHGAGAENAQGKKFIIELEDDMKIPTIAKESVIRDAIFSGSIPSIVVKEVKGLQTVLFPNRGKFVPIFTDKNEAEKIRKQFLTFGQEHSYNIIAVGFDEILSILLSCDGSLVDMTTYSYLIPKAMLENIKAQMAGEKNEGDSAN